MEEVRKGYDGKDSLPTALFGEFSPKSLRARSPLSRGTVIFTRYFDSRANTGIKDSDSLTGMSDWRF